MNKDHAAGFGLGLLTGAIAGGIIALLYAPKAGEVTRRLIKGAATDVADTVKEAASGAGWKKHAPAKAKTPKS